MRAFARDPSGHSLIALSTVLISANWIAFTGCGSRPEHTPEEARLDEIVILESVGATVIDGDRLGCFSPEVNVEGLGVLHDGKNLWEGGKWSNEAMLMIAVLHRQGRANWISMNDTPLSDAGLEELVNCVPNLEALLVGGTQITDKSLVHVGKLRHLKVLWLLETQITNAGLSYLTGLNELVELNLHGTAVTDDGLAQLSKFTALKTLYLADTGVTDAGLSHLKSLQGLRHLWVQGTGISEEGVRQIRTALTNCKVVGTNDKLIADETAHIEQLTAELVKVLTRRGKAYAAIGEKDKAAVDFDLATLFLPMSRASESSGRSAVRANNAD